MLKNNKMQILLKTSVVLLITTAFLIGCGKKQESLIFQEEELMTSEQANYKTVQVKTGDYEKEATGSASIVYLLSKDLYWENNKSYFKNSLVKTGQEVKEGDVLMAFTTEENRLELETLNLQLLRAREQFEIDNTEKFAELHAAKVKAEELKDDYEIRIAELRIEKMQAKYEQFLYETNKKMCQMEKQIAEIKAEAEKNVLVAPFDGVVDDIARLNEDDQVSKGQWLVKMHSTDKMLIAADNLSGKLRYNMDVIIETGRKDDVKSYTGTVIAASHILPFSASQKQALIELAPNISAKQFKGSIKFRSINEDIHNILMVERKAIHREDGEEYVYILEGDVVQKRYVKTTLNSTEGVWILDGLEEGQTLITD